MSDVVFVDTETLGLDADVHPVWEVALILPSGREHVRQIEVTPRELSLAHPKALEIGRFHERYQKDTDTDRPEDVAEWLWNVIPDGAHLCGAVVSFDEERLRRLLWRFGYTPPWHYHLLDCEALAVGYILGREAQYQSDSGSSVWGPVNVARELPWRSEDLSRAVGVDPERFEKHTALGDARWAKAMYESVMGAS